MSILVDVKYHSSYVYLIFGVWIAFFKMSANIIANIAHAKKLIFPYAVAGILSVVATQFEYYKYLIPSALLVASVFGYMTMYIWMKRLVPIRLKSSNFMMVLLYSAPFFLGMLFYGHASTWQYSLGVLLVFGLYFLYVLYILIKRGEVIE